MLERSLNWLAVPLGDIAVLSFPLLWIFEFTLFSLLSEADNALNRAILMLLRSFLLLVQSIFDDISNKILLNFWHFSLLFYRSDCFSIAIRHLCLESFFGVGFIQRSLKFYLLRFGSDLRFRMCPGMFVVELDSYRRSNLLLSGWLRSIDHTGLNCRRLGGGLAFRYVLDLPKF
jgi:hypothetical protein